MREMLRAQQGKQAVDAQRVADLQFDLELAVVQNGTATAAAAAAPAAAPAAVKGAAPAGAETPRGALYQISFRPYLHLLARGNDPLRMFRELRDLGDLQVTANVSALPAIEEFDPENCYLSWQLKLRTEAPRQSIVEVFDWAEGDCELEVKLLEAEPAATAKQYAQGRARRSHRHIRGAGSGRRMPRTPSSDRPKLPMSPRAATPVRSASASRRSMT